MFVFPFHMLPMVLVTHLGKGNREASYHNDVLMGLLHLHLGDVELLCSYICCLAPADLQARTMAAKMTIFSKCCLPCPVLGLSVVPPILFVVSCFFGGAALAALPLAWCNVGHCEAISAGSNELSLSERCSRTQWASVASLCRCCALRDRPVRDHHCTNRM